MKMPVVARRLLLALAVTTAIVEPALAADWSKLRIGVGRRLPAVQRSRPGRQVEGFSTSTSRSRCARR